MGALSDNEYLYYDRSVHQFGKTNGDFLLEVGKGNTLGHEAEFKFGYNSDLTAGIEEDIVVQGGTYQFLSDSGEAIQASSTSAADVYDLVIIGLDANFVEQVVVVTLTGLTPVLVPGLWTRINRVANNNGTEFTGTVDVVDTATGSKVVARAVPEDQITQQMVYTVPAGKLAYVKLFGMSFNKSGGSGGNAIVRLRARRFGKVFTTTLRAGLQKEGTSALLQENLIPTAFPAKTDIKMSAIASASGSDVSGLMQLVVIEEKFLS